MQNTLKCQVRTKPGNCDQLQGKLYCRRKWSPRPCHPNGKYVVIDKHATAPSKISTLSKLKRQFFQLCDHFDQRQRPLRVIPAIVQGTTLGHRHPFLRKALCQAAELLRRGDLEDDKLCVQPTVANCGKRNYTNCRFVLFTVAVWRKANEHLE